MFQKIILVSFATLVFCTNSPAQNFFWSTSGLGEGAVNDDFDLVVPVGASGRTFLYFDSAGTQDITEGLDGDFSWDVTGVMAFTAAETLEFDITIGKAVFGQRWGDFAGPAESVTADSVTGFLTVNVVNGTGIQVANIPPGNPFVDQGYDITANAFLVGTFDWVATEPGLTSIQIDNIFVVGIPDHIIIPFTEFNVSVIPEPGAATILITSLGILAFCRRRTRQL